jgi:uncharacterized membrane protein YccF (DUF307 family)
MKTDELSGLESLRIIDSMINKARNRFSENGHLYLVWGYTILAITLLQFAVVSFQWLESPHALWGLCFLPWGYMLVYLGRKKRKATVRTYTEEIASVVWLVFAGMMIITGFVLSYTNAFLAMYPAYLILYGMPTTLSGYILRFRPLLLGGLSCWVLSIACLYAPTAYQILFLGAAVVLAWIIPGHLLQLRFQQENSLP